MDFRRIFLDHTVTVTLYSIYILFLVIGRLVDSRKYFETVAKIA